MAIDESFETVSDSRLLEAADQLAAAARVSTAKLVAALAELDKRRLYLGLGYSSLFAYCTSRLHLTEGEAFNRIEAARAAQRFPELLTHLSDGTLSLTAVRLLSPHLTAGNYDDVVKAATRQGTRAIEKLVAHLRPLPPVPSVVRKLPATAESPGPTPSDSALLVNIPPPQTKVLAELPTLPLARRPIVKPLSDHYYKVQVTFSTEAREKLVRAQSLLRHQIPDGDPARVLERGLDALLEKLMKQKVAQTSRPRQPRSKGGSRGIPASVKREVWSRDGAQCVFTAPDGHRCAELGFLEYHHVVPYARGGKATVDNIQLRCRAHNVYEAEREFGLVVREDRPAFVA